MDWFMTAMIDSAAPATTLVQHVDFINRYKASDRCPQAVAALVSRLAPCCLPGPSPLWRTEVDGKPLWPPLQARTSGTSIAKFLDSCPPQVVMYQVLEIPLADRDISVGTIGSSRFDLNIALMAAATAIALGVLELQIRAKYDG